MEVPRKGGSMACWSVVVKGALGPEDLGLRLGSQRTLANLLHVSESQAPHR